MFLINTLYTPNTVVYQLFALLTFILLQITFTDFSIQKRSRVYEKRNEIWYKELLNFHKPLPLDISIFLDNEKNVVKWSIDKAVKMSVLLIVANYLKPENNLAFFEWNHWLVVWMYNVFSLDFWLAKYLKALDFL